MRPIVLQYIHNGVEEERKTLMVKASDHSDHSDRHPDAREKLDENSTKIFVGVSEAKSDGSDRSERLD